jgi:hypothetical protein
MEIKKGLSLFFISSRGLKICRKVRRTQPPIDRHFFELNIKIVLEKQEKGKKQKAFRIFFCVDCVIKDKRYFFLKHLLCGQEITYKCSSDLSFA